MPARNGATANSSSASFPTTSIMRASAKRVTRFRSGTWIPPPANGPRTSIGDSTREEFGHIRPRHACGKADEAIRADAIVTEQRHTQGRRRKGDGSAAEG